MKYYHSDFNKTDSEFLYQTIEDLKPFLSNEALFLLEEQASVKGRVRIVLKVKEKGRLFLVDSTAPNLLQAAQVAKETMIELILQKFPLTQPEPLIKYIYN